MTIQIGGQKYKRKPSAIPCDKTCALKDRIPCDEAYCKPGKAWIPYMPGAFMRFVIRHIANPSSGKSELSSI